MKPLQAFLWLSLAANAALTVAVFMPRWGNEPARATSAVTARSSGVCASQTESIAAVLAAHPDFVAAMQNGDMKRWRDALTRAGFPSTYVREMITSHTANSVLPERLQLMRLSIKRPFWQTAPGDEELTLHKTTREHREKGHAMAQEAFGGKIPPHPFEATTRHRRLGFLSPDKIADVARIESEFNEKFIATRRMKTLESVEPGQHIRVQERGALAKVLTADELQLYDLTVTPTAEAMRHTLAHFSPTEQEFKALFEVRREFDDKYGMLYDSADERLNKQRRADEKALNEKLRVQLGEPRYAEYVRAQDYGYRAAMEIVSHFNLPPANAVQVYQLQGSVQTRFEENSRAGDPTAVASRNAQVLADANAQFTRLLGAKGFDAYKKSGGAWLHAYHDQLRGAAVTTK